MTSDQKNVESRSRDEQEVNQDENIQIAWQVYDKDDSSVPMAWFLTPLGQTYPVSTQKNKIPAAGTVTISRQTKSKKITENKKSKKANNKVYTQKKETKVLNYNWWKTAFICLCAIIICYLVKKQPFAQKIWRKIWKIA